MSLISLGNLGIERDIAPPRRRGVLAPTGVGPGTGNATRTSTRTGTGNATGTGTDANVAGFGQLLVAQIPGEALLAYTTLLALFAVGGSDYRIGRWILYGAIVAICPIVVIMSYLARRNFTFVDPQPVKPPAAMVNNPLDIVNPASDADVGATPAAPRRRLHLPLLPAGAATASMAVYGLTVPGSALQYSVSHVGFAIIAGCLAVGGGVMMAIVAPFLARPNDAQIAPWGDA